MTTFPVRGVGRSGVIPDQSPYDLPLDAWTEARNIRFAGRTASRYSIFRDQYPHASFGPTEADRPVGVARYQEANSDPTLLVVSRDYRITEVTPTSTQDVTPVSGTWTQNDSRITYATLAGCAFINRSSDVPLSRIPTATKFTALPYWPVNDRCKSLRSYKDFLIALNVTKGAVAYPTMIKWSNATQYGSVPPDWDTANPASLSGEDIVNDIQSPLLDGLGLGDSFIIYSTNEVLVQEFIGAPLVFRRTKLFSDDGMIAANCVVDVNNRHYVFGIKDIYVHDGISKESLTQDILNNETATTVKDYIYSTINYEYADRSFVVHNAANSEIMFCYVSLLDETPWNGMTNPNMAAVYNYSSRTWTFVDLPACVGGAEMPADSAQTWEDLPSWPEIDSSWASLGSKGTRLLCLLSSGNQTLLNPVNPKIYSLDDLKAPRSNRPIATDVSWTAYIRREGIDLDEIGAEISGRKMLSTIYPQVAVIGDDDEFLIRLGRSIYSGSTVEWEAPVRFRPSTQYKVDTRNTGRYLAMEFIIPPGSYAELSGYDLDIKKLFGR